jgi:competence protein ComFB
MALVNIMESVVKQKLDELLEKSDHYCKCEKCYYDMMAIALNYCQPRYVNTLKGELLVKLNSTERQSAVDIDINILKAMEIVKNHPQHDKN